MAADPPWVVIWAPKLGKTCPRLRSGGCPGTKSRQNVPAAPPQVVVRVKATEFLQEWGGKNKSVIASTLPTDPG